MMVVGVDAHKRSHTAVTVDELGRQGSTKTVGTRRKVTSGSCNGPAVLVKSGRGRSRIAGT
jgi:hypothetical protein